MTPATRDRLRAAVLALPKRTREVHLQALAMLLHLLEHCEEGRQPLAFVAGDHAFHLPALRWAAETLRHPWLECTATDCTEPNHVSLITEPVGLERKEGGKP